MPRKLRLGILFGGRSGEHEISLRSAENIIAAADPKKYIVVPIGITKQGQWRVGGLPRARARLDLQSVLRAGTEVVLCASPRARFPLIPVQTSVPFSRLGKLDVVFPVLHCTFGEDGTVQGLLELAGIPYVGAGVLGSAAGMDKDVMKRLFRERGLPIVPHLLASRAEVEKSARKVANAAEKQLRYPVFVKPANLGSSVGISKARNRKELEAALLVAAEYDRKIVIEQGVEGREIECAVLGNDAPIASV
ncbi:MAG: D-alanine--D-alanine ligase, partial [Acidobacteria bacterium]|nr:D-alanine--D-alanine ligase [Acidobacteriota bacterium]